MGACLDWLYVLLLLVFDSFIIFWQHQDAPKPLSVCFMSQTWNQLVFQLLSKSPTERVLVH